ncbi:hypothetical protein GYMLUDRAFT_101391 [Collybiopsis luxurians FD-317 M1]|uniref:DNA 3'-5' helicase n=1 Tax=Collybiopsis luxurians FD-317 M1 TaxID=944289 RepID=A0A0D0B6K2_9AGAR|nr:hypothetical protein GYMLUDRAFT_101391 [Collybiopsis luxurians FD-317 M1]
MPDILQMLEISDPSLVREIRHYTGRTNHVYTHKSVESDDLVDEVQSYIDSLPQLDLDERGIIYVHDIQRELKPIADKLGFPTYYAGMNDADKRSAMWDWTEGRSSWIVATTAFGEGIDYAHVRCVVSVNPFGLTTKKQEDGRAGRDGRVCWCHTIWTRLPEVWRGKEDTEGAINLRAYYTTQSCLRFAEEPYDGRAHSCAALGAELCQNCVLICKDHPNLYLGPGASRLDIPLVPVLPKNHTAEFDTPMDVDQVPLTVEAATASIRTQFIESNADLELFKEILDRIEERGCIECFVLGRTHVPGHQSDLSANRKFRDFHLSILARKMPLTWSKSYCFLCWVPFRPPCMHRTALPNQRLVESDCPYNATSPRLIPTLIAHIWMDQDIVGRIAGYLEREKWRNTKELLEWLSEAMDKVSDLPNPIRFVIAYYKSCVAI